MKFEVYVRLSMRSEFGRVATYDNFPDARVCARFWGVRSETAYVMDGETGELLVSIAVGCND